MGRKLAVIGFIGAGGIISALAARTAKINGFINSLDVKVKPKITGYSGGKIKLHTDIELDNPKSFSATLQKPTVRIYTKDGKLIAKSKPTTEEGVILGNSISILSYDFDLSVLNPVVISIITNAGETISNVINQVTSGNLTKLLGIELDVKLFLNYKGVEKEITIPTTI